MSNMSDLDIVLSEYRLSDAQKNAVLEVIDLGYTLAKANTINSLEKKGLIVRVNETHHSLGDDLASKVNPVIERNRAVSEEFDKGGENGDKADSVDDVKMVEEPYAQWELDVMGFGKWRNTDGAWDGLSREEIKEDIKTAFPINRAARRKHTRLLASEYRKLFCPRPRKALKLTGKVGV